MPSIKILIKTLYIIKDKYIYEKYIYNNHNENIFLCITEEKTRKICYEDIQQILTKIYKQYELLNIKKQLQTSTYSINTIYKYLLNISEEKITQKQLKKSFIICLLNNEINPYALFNINLQNKNDQSFEEKMRKYIKYYGKEKVQQQYLVILMCKQILNLPN